uniref:Sugar phosphate transporter domain-containing protein n=1 Tax=Ditylum brightwellii TaxID=49249 RepID=A0A7S1ZZ84_9STRA|mmetsp:Transcript_454/g.708  ORF Transcript_454/g.708 Transcript_454/m.708 type:complete len:568 (+) Transcript_454:133-1836(+)
MASLPPPPFYKSNEAANVNEDRKDTNSTANGVAGASGSFMHTTNNISTTSRFRGPLPPPPSLPPIPTPPYAVKSRHPSSSSIPLLPPPQSSYLPAPRDLDDNFVSQNVKDNNPKDVSAVSTTVPGRARRRTNNPATTFSSPSSANSMGNVSIRQRRKNRRQLSSQKNNPKWSKLWLFIFPPSKSTKEHSSPLSIPAAVLLWYFLGVCSITTSKILLTDYKENGLTPSVLTIQQFTLGVSFLRLCMVKKWFGGNGIVKWNKVLHSGLKSSGGGFVSNFKNSTSASSSSNTAQLFLTGLFFSLGFWATNYSFQASDASFVETVKAAEPITSASVAVLWKIEVLSWEEAASLGGIVVGVLTSTLANGMMSTKTAEAASAGSLVSSSVGTAIRACAVVMTANLCFSFRGLYQKIFRASPQGNPSVMDDMNLQYRMQQIGILLCLIPVLLFDMPHVIRELWDVSDKARFMLSWVFLRYVSIAVINGFAFTSYNLASTYILTRISVVHHAALNCIRRVFAIIVTSIVFRVPITTLSAFGIAVSVGGFFSFSHFKMKRLRRPRPLSSLLPMSEV